MSVRSSVQTVVRGPVLGRRGVREIALLAALYLIYSVTRSLGDSNLALAQERGGDLLQLEQTLHLDWEHGLNGWFAAHAWAAVPADYYYASMHYVVTLVVLIWLYRKGAVYYAPARWALVVTCLVGLACYLLLPTAPPRLTGGYLDIMSLHADLGWWSTNASAPKGLGSLANELAAFPSLHAAWSLWVALVVRRTARSRWVRGLAWLHPVLTALVVVGTANHWTLDVLVGWALAIVAVWLVDPWFADRREQVQARRGALAQRDVGLLQTDGRSTSRAAGTVAHEQIEPGAVSPEPGGRPRERGPDGRPED